MTSTTPYTELPNQNEYLFKPQQENNQQNIDINNFLVENKDKSFGNKFILTFLIYRILMPFFIIPILCGFIIPISVIKNVKLYTRIIFIVSGVIISLIILINSNNKLEIIKDKSNNKIIVKLINFLWFPKIIVKIDFENFHFYFKEFIFEHEEGTSIKFIFTIINDYKNLVDIDLDTSNIKQKPANFFYRFHCLKHIENAEKKYTADLNNFLGLSSDNYSNPLLFNIHNYMEKKANTEMLLINEDYLSQYMKFSEHLFTFHFRSLLQYTYIDVAKYVISILFNCLAVVLTSILYYIKGNPFQYFCIFSTITVNIILYIVFKCLKNCLENIYRIDCIFSRNFDRIFIGLVKYTKTSYVNTFEFQMNYIEQFILEKISNDNYDLKVVFKNKEKHLICNIKKSQKELEGLIYLLNERLINNTDGLNTIDNNGKLYENI